jgi:hypothetical protein
VKINTLKGLQVAYVNGALSRDEPLTVDNDSTYVYTDNGVEFEMHPADLLEQALDLLGIPHQEP